MPSVEDQESGPPTAGCGWERGSARYRAYHDREWGVPVYDDRTLFECLILEGAQAGLSWITILNKREGYRRLYEGFDPERVAQFDDRRIEALVRDPAIVRHRGKIEASIGNARALLAVQAEQGSFVTFIWSFIGGVPRHNHWTHPDQVPASSAESEAMSRALRKRGFRFVGPTICYAFMQATGMVNDHLMHCFRHRELIGE